MAKHKPPSGFEGNLSKDQIEKLKEAWRVYFKVMSGEGSGAIGGIKADKSAADSEDAKKKDRGTQGDSEAAFKDKSKDDKAKEEETRQREEKETAALLGSYSPEELRKAFWDGSRGESPDALMLRFLRARKWDVDRAFAMAASVGKWRLEMDVEGIKAKGEEGLCKEEGFRLQYDVGKTYIMGTDKQDRPLVYIHVAKHKIGDQTQEALQRFTIFGIESAKSLLTPRSNGQGCIIFDLTNFGLQNMDWQCLRFLIEVFEARYPETLGALLIHKAPTVALGIWYIVKPFLDPNVRAKIFFTNNENDLAEFVDKKHIKKSMGGDLAWEWSYSGPAAGENSRMQDQKSCKEVMKNWHAAIEEFEDLTRKWIDGDDEAGKKRETYGNDLIMIRYYDSDPYVRGQTIYSRNGTAVGDGRVRWKYPDHEETFGRSYNEVRQEMGIAGKCPENGHPDGPVAAAKHELEHAKDPDEAAAAASGKDTSSSDWDILKRYTANMVSVIAPGKSNADQAREDAQREKDRLQREYDDAKRKESDRKADEDRRQKEAQEKALKEKEASEKGLMNNIWWAGATVATTAMATAHAASDYVPAQLGGNYLAKATGPRESSEKELNASEESDLASETSDVNEEGGVPPVRTHRPSWQKRNRQIYTKVQGQSRQAGSSISTRPHDSASRPDKEELEPYTADHKVTGSRDRRIQDTEIVGADDRPEHKGGHAPTGIVFPQLRD